MMRMRPPSTPSSIIVALKNSRASSVHRFGLARLRRFQGDDQNPPDRGDQSDHQERFAHQYSGAERDAHRVQDLDDHQHEQQTIDGDDERNGIAALQHRGPQRRPRQTDPDKRCEREHQSENDIGEKLDATEHAAGKRADPATDAVDLVVAVHARPWLCRRLAYGSSRPECPSVRGREQTVKLFGHSSAGGTTKIYSLGLGVSLSDNLLCKREKALKFGRARAVRTPLRGLRLSIYVDEQSQIKNSSVNRRSVVHATEGQSMPTAFPFSAIVAQEEMKLALLIAAVDQTVGGVLVFGDRGTGKSTAVRSLAALLPKMQVIAGCPYGCDPEADRVAVHRRMWGTCRQGHDQEPGGAGSGRRSAARRDRGPGGRRARSRTRPGARRQSLRAGPAGAGPPRISLHRRGQPARGSHRRSAARRGRVRRERRRTRGAQHPPSRAVRPGRHRQSGGRRTAAATPRSVRPVGRGEDAQRRRDARRGRAPSRRVRPRPQGLCAKMEDRGRQGAQAHRRRAGTPRRR